MLPDIGNCVQSVLPTLGTAQRVSYQCSDQFEYIWSSMKRMGKFSWGTEKADRQKCRLSLRYGALNFHSVAIWLQIANSCTRWRCNWLSQHGDGQIFIKIFSPHSLTTTYRMNLISAGSISLGSTFKLISCTKRMLQNFWMIVHIFSVMHTGPFRFFSCHLVPIESLVASLSTNEFIVW